MCMLYKIMCNPLHLLYGALPVPFMPVPVMCGALVAHRCTYAPRSSLPNLAVPQEIYFPLSVPVGRYCDHCIRWCGTGGFKEHCQCFFIGLTCSIPFGLYFFHFSLLPVYRLVLWAGAFGLIGWKLLNPSLALPTSFDKKKKNNNNNKSRIKVFILLNENTNV